MLIIIKKDIGCANGVRYDWQLGNKQLIRHQLIQRTHKYWCVIKYLVHRQLSRTGNYSDYCYKAMQSINMYNIIKQQIISSTILKLTYLPKFGTDLITVLSCLNVNDLAHLECICFCLFLSSLNCFLLTITIGTWSCQNTYHWLLTLSIKFLPLFFYVFVKFTIAANLLPAIEIQECRWHLPLIFDDVHTLKQKRTWGCVINE